MERFLEPISAKRDMHQGYYPQPDALSQLSVVNQYNYEEAGAFGRQHQTLAAQLDEKIFRRSLPISSFVMHKTMSESSMASFVEQTQEDVADAEQSVALAEWGLKIHASNKGYVDIESAEQVYQAKLHLAGCLYIRYMARQSEAIDEDIQSLLSR